MRQHMIDMQASHRGWRYVQVTLARVWDAMPIWSRLRLLWCLVSSHLFMPDSQELESIVEGLKEADIMTQVPPPSLSALFSASSANGPLQPSIAV